MPSSDHNGRRYGYRDELGTCSFHGFAFNIVESDRRLIDLMQTQQDAALAKKMPEYANVLMDELSKNFSAFKDRFEYTSPGANFSMTPIFHYMNIDDAAEIFLGHFAQSRGEAKALLKILGKRRAEHRKELQEEWSWIEGFEVASVRKAHNQSMLLGAQIAQYFKWFLKAG